jgi:hypothetical protein
MNLVIFQLLQDLETNSDLIILNSKTTKIITDFFVNINELVVNENISQDNGFIYYKYFKLKAWADLSNLLDKLIEQRFL